MPSYRFPILVWSHLDGGVTACLVEDAGNVAAIGDSTSAATGQIKEMLQWRYREAPWTGKPDFNEAELSWVKVKGRPEYPAAGKTYPGRELILFRVPCVRG